MSTVRAPRVVVPGAVLTVAVVEVDGGRVVGVRRDGPVDVEPPDGVLAPGLVDLQVNGCYGVDFVDASAQQWDAMTTRLLGTGVTALLPTSTSAPVGELAGGPGRPQSRTTRSDQDPPGGLMDAQVTAAGLGGVGSTLEDLLA